MPLLFLPIGQLLVFPRHALQFMPRVGSCRKLCLPTAQQLERAIGEVCGRLIHRVTLTLRGWGTHLTRISVILTGEALR